MLTYVTVVRLKRFLIKMLNQEKQLAVVVIGEKSLKNYLLVKNIAKLTDTAATPLIGVLSLCIIGVIIKMIRVIRIMEPGVLRFVKGGIVLKTI